MIDYEKHELQLNTVVVHANLLKLPRNCFRVSQGMLNSLPQKNPPSSQLKMSARHTTHECLAAHTEAQNVAESE